MVHSTYDTIDIRTPAPRAVRCDDASAQLTPHLVRIVRRAMKRTDDRSPLACAIRGAVAQVSAEPIWQTSYDEDVRVQLVARRVSAMLSPDYRDPPGRAAHRETVCA